MVRLLQASAISHQILYHLPVHQRFAPEEIHLQVYPVSGRRHQEVKRLLSHFKAHDGPSAMVLPFLCKAVAAGQVAVMGHMQAQRLHHRLTVLEVADILLIYIFCKKLFRFRKLQNLIHRFGKLLLFIMMSAVFFLTKALQHGVKNALSVPVSLHEQLLHRRQNLVNTIVHNMHASAVHIHHDVVAVVSVLMYH